MVLGVSVLIDVSNKDKDGKSKVIVTTKNIVLPPKVIIPKGIDLEKLKNVLVTKGIINSLSDLE